MKRPAFFLIFVSLIFFFFFLKSSFVSSQTVSCNVRDYGARGDGSTDDSVAIQSAIDDCNSRGGGRVVFSPGTYRADKVRIKDNVTLKLQGGDMDDVVIKGTDDGVGPVVDATARGNVGIEGPGTIDRGLGGSLADDPYQEDWEMDKTIVHMRDSTNVSIKDILITSEAYDTHYRGDHLVTSDCVNVTYDNVTVRANQGRSTNDAVHTTNGGRNINIINSHVYAGDDCMVFHGSAAWDPNNDGSSSYDDVLVQNVYVDGHRVQGGIMLTTAGISSDPNSSRQTNMTFDNYYIEDALSEFGWGKGIAINPRGPNVKYENLTFSNVTMRGDVPQPFQGITPYRWQDDITGSEGNNIIFRNIDIYRDRISRDDASEITGMDNVIFENITYLYPAGRSIRNPLISFSDINGLCINNFRITQGGVDIANPYDYLDIDANVTGETMGQPCGGTNPTPTPRPTSFPTSTPRPTSSITPTPTPVFLQGDINGDCEVDIFDYNILLSNFGYQGCGNQADINGDCKVDIFDYNTLLSNFGATCSTSAPTPTPSTGVISCTECQNDLPCSAPCSYYENILTCGEVWKGWWGNSCLE